MAMKKMQDKSANSAAKAKSAKKTKLKRPAAGPDAERAKVLSSEVAYQGRLFRVTKDRIVEPSGKESSRDIVRHNGSAVILAVDAGKTKKDPWIVMERQYRHAAGRMLWELPAGTLDPGEDPWPVPRGNSKKRRDTARRNGGPWCSTSPAPDFWLNR